MIVVSCGYLSDNTHIFRDVYGSIKQKYQNLDYCLMGMYWMYGKLLLSRSESFRDNTNFRICRKVCLDSKGLKLIVKWKGAIF